MEKRQLFKIEFMLDQETGMEECVVAEDFEMASKHAISRVGNTVPVNGGMDKQIMKIVSIELKRAVLVI